MVVYARVNHGRWIVDCPSCNSASLLSGSKFICGDCSQQHNVIIPSNKHEIDKVLSIRPNTINRNWTPGETIETLHLENVLYGVEDI